MATAITTTAVMDRPARTTPRHRGPSPVRQRVRLLGRVLATALFALVTGALLLQAMGAALGSPAIQLGLIWTALGGIMLLGLWRIWSEDGGEADA